MKFPVKADSCREHEPVFVKQEALDRKVVNQHTSIQDCHKDGDDGHDVKELSAEAGQNHPGQGVKLDFIGECPGLNGKAIRGFTGQIANPGSG